MAERCHIIGVLDDGPRGLTAEALELIRRAHLVIGGPRTLALFADEVGPEAEMRDLTGRLSMVPGWIAKARGQGRRVVVLATGDPLCHGIAGFLSTRLPAEALRIAPNLSSVQLACARLAVPWQDMKIVSVHRADAREWREGAGPGHGLYPLLRAVERHDRLAVLTSPENSPDRIARMLVAEGLAGDFRIAVAERLTREDERIVTWIRAEEVTNSRFADPNVLLLQRTAPRRPEVLFGLPDEDFDQRRPHRGLITKREVRAVSLARLQLRGDSIVWDIGAGSGALGLEAARLCPKGHVFAIEKDAEDARRCAENRRRLRARNYSLVEGKAPAGLDAWPDPDAVFIGGSGGELGGLIRLCLHRLVANGVLVLNLVTFENLATAIDTLKASGADWDVTQLQASRSKSVSDMHRLAAENPVWILCASARNDARLNGS